MAYKYLVIVESPTKAKTIEKYLGRNYKVVASKGHLRDLPKSRMAVDIENDYQPDYISIRGKGDLIKELKKYGHKAEKIYLASFMTAYSSELMIESLKKYESLPG